MQHLSLFKEDTGGPSVPVREINLVAYLSLVEPTENSCPDLDLNPGHRRSSACKTSVIFVLIYFLVLVFQLFFVLFLF